MAMSAQSLADRPTLLRRALQADAIISGISVVVLIAGADALAPLLGIPAIGLRGVGMAFVLFVALVAYTATRPVIGRRGAQTVMVLNALWVVDSIILLAAGVLPLTQLGFGFMVFQAAVVGLLAGAQLLGLRQAAQPA